MVSWRDAVGYSSAGALGFIGGNVTGAAIGIGAYNSYRKSMAMMKRKASGSQGRNVKSRTGKSSVLGRKLLTRKYKKKPLPSKVGKGRKLSKPQKSQVRNIALKVIHSEKPIGRYHKRFLCTFPEVVGAPAAPLQNVVNQLLFAGGTYSDSYLSCGNFKKVIDSVSILFGSKGATIPYAAAGDIASDQTIIPDFVQTNIYEFNNNTPLTQNFLIYETTPKEDYNANVYSAWTSMSVTQKGGSTRTPTYFGMRPEYYPQFKDQYRILKKRLVTLLPGKRFVYSMSTKKQHIHLDKWVVPASGVYDYRKGFTKELLIINWASQINGAGAVGYTAGSWNMTSTDAYGIGIDVQEHYSARCPENVSNVNSDDNTLCVYTAYGANVTSGTTNTVVAPSITFPSMNQ